MPGDEHLAVIRQEAQLFDPAHTGFGRTTGETPIREIQQYGAERQPGRRLPGHRLPFEPEPFG